MNNVLRDVNFYDGVIELNDFDYQFEKSSQEQKWFFKNDILQVQYYDGQYVLDVGWLPEFNLIEGSFKIVVVQDYDWDNPIFCKRTNDVKKAISYIQEGANFIKEIKVK